MTKLKGMKRVNRIINEFANQFGVTAKLDMEFQAFCDTMTIGYTLFFDEESRYYFVNDAEKRYPEVKADIFLWAFMHEIGHCMTDHLWNEEDQGYFEQRKEDIICIQDDQERNDCYHSCPDEYFATKWAGDYMRDHAEEIAEFWNELQTAIIRMYRKNGVI